MNSLPTTTAVVLPASVDQTNQQPITEADCLHFIGQRAKTLLDANLIMIAGGVIYIYIATVFVADKHKRKTVTEAKASLAKVFGESDHPNSSVSRTKRYEFAKLCVEIAAQKETRPLVTKAAKQSSIEAAAADLAAEFALCASSVAGLARHFGTERSSGRRRRPQESVKRPFLLLLRALVAKAKKDDQRIPFAESVKELAPAASQRDIAELIRDLIPFAADHEIPELVDILNRVAERRRAHA